MSFGQVFFITFVLYLPEWASGDKNLCSTLSDIINIVHDLKLKIP